MGARMVPANGQTTKTKKIFYMSFWLERLSILLQIQMYIHSRAIFVLEKGGVLLLGTVLLLGHIRYTPETVANWTFLDQILLSINCSCQLWQKVSF